MKIKVVDALYADGYENGDIMEVTKYKSENGCWAVNKEGNQRFLLKHEYIVLEEEK